MLTVDIALVSFDDPAFICLLLKLKNGGVAINSCATSAGTFGQRLGEVGGLNIAIVRVLNRANNALYIGHGPGFFNLLWGQKIDLDTYGLSDAGVILIFVHAILVGGQANIGNYTEANILFCLFFQLMIEVHRVLVQFAH